MKGRALDKQGRFADAVECFGKALENGGGGEE
ncbi:tetratricopeptide repeat protein [Methanoculleus chikugoensis]|nr:tetratricopeptide repeat protein [Methanoculleus chikugoensis]